MGGPSKDPQEECAGMNGLYPDSFGLSVPLETHHGSVTTPVPLSDGVCGRENLIDLICLAASFQHMLLCIHVR